MKSMKINLYRVLPGWLLTLILITLIPAGRSARAQQLFTLDAAGFRQQAGLIYLEVYLMVQRDRLKFVQGEDGFEALCEITANLSSPDSLISTTTWQFVDRINRLDEITPSQKLPDIVVYNVAPGDYQIECRIQDLNSGNVSTRSLDLSLHSYSDSSLSLSNIELATRLQKSEGRGKFIKNGFLVVPNPERLYGVSLPMLYYYAEIYNLVPSEQDFSVDRCILNSAREEVKRLPEKRRHKVGASVVDVDGISVASLESGTYYLELIAKDHETGQTDTAETKFFVYRPGDFAERAASPESKQVSADELEIMGYTEQELDNAVEELKYLLPDSDWRSVKKLNAEGKRSYLIRFWNERDPDPTTTVNEFKKVFEERREYADQKYGVFDREGWKTDRGRVYVVYGLPDDIEYHTHDLDTRSYEIWYYDSLEGGVQFVFVDRNNFGDYRLAHSTKTGELYRPNWFQDEATVRGN